jgi:hypothetical protein
MDGLTGSGGFSVPWGPVEMAVLRRALTLWLMIRLVVTAFLVPAGAHPFWLHPKAALIVIASVGYLSWLDTRRRNEHLLLANLGTPRWLIHGLGFAPVLILELGFGVLSRI